MTLAKDLKMKIIDKFYVKKKTYILEFQYVEAYFAR